MATERFEYLEGQEKKSFSFQDCSFEQVPQTVLAYDQAERDRRDVPDDAWSLLSSHLFVHSNGDNTFVLRRQLPFAELSYLYDIDSTGEILGQGHLRFMINRGSRSKHKPFVNWTENTILGRGKGLGKRRVLMMGVLSQNLYNLSINSDSRLTDNAKRVWEVLIDEGYAEKYFDGFHNRYRLISESLHSV